MSDNLIEKYFNYIKNERRFSENTLEAYKQDVIKFNEYIHSRDISSIIDINKTTIITYLLYLENTGMANSTISRNLASLRCLFQYLLNSNIIREDPTFNLKSTKTERKIPNVLSEGEIDLLLAQPNTKNLKGTRDKAMIQLICTTGLRVSQMLNLNIEDIDINSGLIYIKEEDTRIIALNKSMLGCLTNYLDEYRSKALKRDPLFINLYGDRLTRQGFWKILKQYTKKTGINKPITPHTLRHSFATNMINSGVDIREIQKILGHSELSTTETYLFEEDNNR